MNPILYQMLATESSLRIVIRKNPDGTFLLGLSTGKFDPLLCSGTPEAIHAELDAKLPEYRKQLRHLEIEAKLAGVHEVPFEPDEDGGDDNEEETPLPPAGQAATQEDQSDLDFGF